MHTRTAISWLGTALLVLSACSEDPPAKDPSSVASKDSKSSETSDETSGDKGEDTKGGGGGSEISCKGEPAVGKSGTSFKLTSINGGDRMSIEKGKVTIVDFWATWCEPCKKSFPKYQELYVKYKSSGLQILALSVDDEKKDIPSFIKTHGAKFPVGWDEGHAIADCYKPPNMPSAYVIDKKGVVKHIHNGYHDGEEKALEKEIKALL